MKKDSNSKNNDSQGFSKTNIANNKREKRNIYSDMIILYTDKYNIYKINYICNMLYTDIYISMHKYT